MKTTRLLLVTAGLCGLLLSTALAQRVTLQPLIVANPVGTLHVQQEVLCGRDVDATTRVAAGRIEIQPVEGIRSGDSRLFELTRITIFFAPYRLQRECLGFRETRVYSEIGVRLAGAVLVRGTPIGDDVFGITIPKDKFLIYMSLISNRMPQTGYRRPSEDVTGEIDLARGTVRLHVMLFESVRFQAGCRRDRCIIDEELRGTQTADIGGTIESPDADAGGVRDPGVTLNSCVDRRTGVARATVVCRGR